MEEEVIVVCESCGERYSPWYDESDHHLCPPCLKEHHRLESLCPECGVECEGTWYLSLKEYGKCPSCLSPDERRWFFTPDEDF